MEIKRVLIYGVTGSGKTTLAKRLAERTGIPWHSVDDLTWEPDWVQVPIPEQTRRIEAICSEESWILDTAYGHWLSVPLGAAQLIVTLDYPSWRSFGRLVWRTLRRIVDKSAICNGNHESLKTMLSSDSILLWHFKSFQRKRDRMAQWAQSKSGPTVVRIQTPKQLEDWINSIEPGLRHLPL